MNTTKQPTPEQPPEPTHEIVDIHWDDAHAHNKERLIGLRGTTEAVYTQADVPEGYQSADFHIPRSQGDSRFLIFFAVKLKALNGPSSDQEEKTNEKM